MGWERSLTQSRPIVQSWGGMHGSRFSVAIAHLLIHLSAMLTKIFVALHIKLDKVAHFHRVDLACAAVADLVNGFPQDVFVFVLIDVLALVVRLDGQLNLLHRTLLGVQLLQVLVRIFALPIPGSFTCASHPRGQTGRGWSLGASATQ